MLVALIVGYFKRQQAMIPDRSKMPIRDTFQLR